MARVEVLSSWFFPIPKLRNNGVIVPAPEEALKKYRELRDGWMENHPELPHEEPSVSLSPSGEPGKEGYFVRAEIIYNN